MRGEIVRTVKWLAVGLLLAGPLLASTLTAVTTNDHGTVAIGAVNDLTYRLTAVGGTITVSSATVSAAPFSKISDACTGNTGMTAGATCDITVRYAPTAVTASSGTLTVVIAGAGAAGGTQKIVSFSGTGSAAAAGTVTLTPASSDFGTISVNSISSQSFTITNTHGSASFSVTSATVATSLGGIFTKTLDNCTGATLAASGTCTVQVTFAPDTVGEFSSGTLTVVTTASNGTTKVSSFSGTAGSTASGTQTLTPASHDFGSVSVGGSSSQAFTITNTHASASFSVTSATVAGATFTKTLDNCTGVTLAASGTCTVQVTYAPTAVGAISTGTLTVVTTASNGTTKLSSFTGTGVANSGVKATITPDLREFGIIALGSTALQTFTLKHTGTSGILTTTTVVVAPAAGPYRLLSDGCSGVSLTTGQTCTFIVSFIPVATGAVSGSVTVTTNASEGSGKIAVLSGTGSSGDVLQFPVTAFTVGKDSKLAIATVTRLPCTSSAVSVDYATVPGTAAAEVHYKPVSGTLSWSAGDCASKSISISILSGDFSEDSRSFSVALTNPQGNAALGTNSFAQTNIGEPPSATAPVTNVEKGCSASGSPSGLALFLGLLVFLAFSMSVRKNSARI